MTFRASHLPVTLGDTIVFRAAGGAWVTIDAADWPLASIFRWSANKDHSIHAAVNAVRPRRRIRLSRLLLQAPQQLHVDHINGNRLDNRRANLRLATNTENMRNMRRHSDARSRFKGVWWYCNHWHAQICANRKKHYLGSHPDETTAARAYDTAAKQLHGEFARLNFPEVAA